MENMISFKKVDDKDELKKVYDIRKEVFIKEQKVPYEIEINGEDKNAEHFLAFYENKPVGCARIRKNNYTKIERLAILKKYRNKGFGKKFFQFLIDYCKKRGDKKIVIHSQLYITDFYKRFGFKSIGKTFYEAGIKHVKMVLEII